MKTDKEVKMTKKQIVEEFLGKMKQHYPRCATTIFESNGDGFALVTIYIKGRTIQMNIEWDDPKWNGYDEIYIIVKETDEVLFKRTDRHIGSILKYAEKAFEDAKEQKA